MKTSINGPACQQRKIQTRQQGIHDNLTGANTPPVAHRLVALIKNCLNENATCALAHWNFGMGEYGALGVLLAKVNLRELDRCMNLIDEVRATHAKCIRCSLKFLAFCMAFTRSRLPHRFMTYELEFEELRARLPEPRDFRAEIADAIYRARKEGKPRPTNTKFFHEME